MSAGQGEQAWFGHPRGLTILFLTEMWEKFSFYGMRALLVYYMTTSLLIGPAGASLVYGLYTAIVYLTPILGGAIADRWLGKRRAVVIGGSIMAAGHFLMIFEPLFYPALAVIALGNGLFLPSLPSQIRSLYGPDDPRQGSAYNVYYMGVNLGAFLAPLVCGFLGETFGWHWGFGAAGIGMLLGLLVYVLGRRHLPVDEPAAVVVRSAASETPDLRRLFLLLGGVALAVVVFRIAYEQTGNTLALWIESSVDRRVAGGWMIPMTWFQALNPLLVLLLTPFVVARMTRAAQRRGAVDALATMSFGAALVASSFLLLVFVQQAAQVSHAPVSWIWLLAFFLLLTIGELHILPVGLGLFGRLAPARLAATMVAAWFLAAFAGNLLAGLVGAAWSAMGACGFFGLMGGMGLTSALLLLCLARPVRRFEARLSSTRT